jgi:cobalt-zinc-cadmium efflux system membrane fusion protein
VSGHDGQRMRAGKWSRARAPRAARWSVVAVGVGAGVLLAMLAGPGLVQSVASQPAPPGILRPTETEWKSLKIVTVEAIPFRSESVAEGNIAIDDDLATPVYSPYSGRVVELFAKPGDLVERGAPLFSVEASEFAEVQNDLITALSGLRTATAQATQAEVSERRAHDLYLAQGGALEDWQQSQTGLAAAQSVERSAEIALAAVRNRLRTLGKSDQEIAALEAEPAQKIDLVAIVGAPIAGTVTRSQVSAGQYINSVATGAMMPVYTIGDLSTVWLLASAREGDVPLMHLGAPVEVRVPAYPGRVFKARISWAGPTLDPNTHRLPLRVDVENPDGALKPMMFTNLSITTGKRSLAPAVPQIGVVYEGHSARVWLARGDQTLELRPVKIGRVQNGMVEIVDGVKTGDKVVTGGAQLIDRRVATD